MLRRRFHRTTAVREEAEQRAEQAVAPVVIEALDDDALLALLVTIERALRGRGYPASEIFRASRAGPQRG